MKAEDNMSTIDPNSIWKFKSKEVLISEMDEVSVMKAILHSLKRIHYYHKKHAYCQEELQKEDLSNSKIRNLEYNLKKSKDVKRDFIERLSNLEDRASVLGITVPDSFEGVKKLLSEIDERQLA